MLDDLELRQPGTDVQSGHWNALNYLPHRDVQSAGKPRDKILAQPGKRLPNLEVETPPIVLHRLVLPTSGPMHAVVVNGVPSQAQEIEQR